MYIIGIPKETLHKDRLQYERVKHKCRKSSCQHIPEACAAI